jgi:hypothetical protein
MTQPIHPLIAVTPQRAAAPTAPMQMQRSLYLAQALRNMRDSAAREATAESIRTPGALAANLLAEALRRYGQDHAQQGSAAAPAQGPESASSAPLPPPGPPAAPVAAPLQVGGGPNPNLPAPPAAADPSAPTDPGAIPAPPPDPQAADPLRRGYRPTGGPWTR